MSVLSDWGRGMLEAFDSEVGEPWYEPWDWNKSLGVANPKTGLPEVGDNYFWRVERAGPHVEEGFRVLLIRRPVWVKYKNLLTRKVSVERRRGGLTYTEASRIIYSKEGPLKSRSKAVERLEARERDFTGWKLYPQPENETVHTELWRIENSVMSREHLVWHANQIVQRKAADQNRWAAQDALVERWVGDYPPRSANG